MEILGGGGIAVRGKPSVFAAWRLDFRFVHVGLPGPKP